ncbi:serine aminopeptidase S33 family [Sinobacterium caligoides]|uniref:Serine aminopeptidase S33 family n=1 Tax=Sinobacterium caligoides TaxID=933926 RepID=A0A3N2DDV9_9GAMM|nr:alpha/beta fold hydrolase [Sinobacterium caligoides]ROR97963.1 serine aminopeptidase S33 family [Sinobacterium caligoides]
MQQQASHFTVDGTRLQAYFHRPERHDDTALPIVVMGNGFATEWQFGTRPAIEAFTAAGIATMNFDYRSFGQSDGEPRQVVDIPGQQDDFLAALEHARAQPWVDARRIIIWGSSLGGGHAISMAARFPSAFAMIAQVPHCCSRAAFKTVALGNVLTGMSRAIADSLKALFGGKPILLPAVAEPEQYAVMNYPGWRESYQQHLAKGSTTWQNSIPARSLLKGGDYRPLLVAEQIRCPSLLVAARDDAGVPLASVRQTAAMIANAQLKIIDGDHFGVYYGPHIDDVVEAELTFIKQQLLHAESS